MYTLDSPTPCVAGNYLVCDAKLVIDPVRHMVLSYWHVDLYVTPPPPRNIPSLRTMSADEQPAASVSTANKWLHDCDRMLDVGSSAVEPQALNPSSALALL